MGTYKPDDLVVLHSLRNRADLNGACGRVVYAKEDVEVAADRHAVQVQRADGSTETLGVKPTNLRLPKDLGSLQSSTHSAHCHSAHCLRAPGSRQSLSSGTR